MNIELYNVFQEKDRLVKEINRLKKQKNAVILAHNYMKPEVTAIADFTGDSLQLAIEASKSTANTIVQAGVYFMAETSKILNPEKTVLIPDLSAGCSLAAGITPEDVIRLKKKYPGVPVVTYVNTSAAVKALSDICCTSANALQVVESLGVPRVIMIPDEYLAKNVATKTNVEIITHSSHCEVHKKFRRQELEEIRNIHPDAPVLVHPECSTDVVELADFTGSTRAMDNWIEINKPKEVMLVTECSMGANIKIRHPEIDFIQPCHICPYMGMITLPAIEQSLREHKYEVIVPEGIRLYAKKAIDRMLELKL